MQKEIWSTVHSTYAVEVPNTCERCAREEKAGRCWIQRFFSFYVQKMSVVDDLKFLTYFCIVSINLAFDSFEIKSEQDRPYSIYRR